MTKDVFFNKLVNGDVWSAGVAFERTNQLPLDKYSVFESLEAANTYLAEGVAYPGQVLAVIDGEPLTATVYVIDVNAEGVHSLKEVGTKPVGDGKSIEIKNDKITIYGFEEASAQTYPRKKADGTIEWVTVQELVEGATENTITVGDEKSIVASETDTGYELAIAGYDEAKEYTVPVKMPSGAISWQEVLQPNKDIEVETIVATSIVLGDKVISAKEDDSGTVGIQIDNDLIATEKHVADNYVTIDGFDQFAEELVEIANGKTHTYVVNNLDQSDSAFKTLGKEDIVISGGYIRVDNQQITNAKIGDIFLIKDLAYIDRWVSNIDNSTSNPTFTLSALETEKVDLNGYATEDYVGDAVKGFVKSVNDVEPDELGNVLLTTAELYHGESNEPLADVIDLIQEDVQELKDTKLNKTLTEEVVYNREGTKTNDVEALLKGMASEVTSHDYALESKVNRDELNNYVVKPTDDEYVLKSVYDAHVEDFNAASQAILSQGQNIADLQKNINETIPATYATQESLGEQVQLLQGQIDDIEVPDVSNKEDKGKLTATTPSSGNRNGVYYVPLTDKALDSTGDASLVQLVSGDGSHPLAVQMTSDGILLKAGTSGIVNINGNAATASVANSLSADAKVNVNQLIQTEGEFLTLNGGSADSRA